MAFLRAKLASSAQEQDEKRGAMSDSHFSDVNSRCSLVCVCCCIQKEAWYQRWYEYTWNKGK